MAGLSLQSRCVCTPSLQQKHTVQRFSPSKPAVYRPSRSCISTKAFLRATDVAQIAEAAPGSVDAPIWVIVGGAVVVTVGSLLASLLLKSGTDASIEMQDRDRKKWNK